MFFERVRVSEILIPSFCICHGTYPTLPTVALAVSMLLRVVLVRGPHSHRGPRWGQHLYIGKMLSGCFLPYLGLHFDHLPE